MGRLSENIVVLRHQNKMSHSALAEKLYVTPQAISRWERGETQPDVDTIKRLSEVFGCTLDDIINGPETALDRKKVQRIHLGYMIGSIGMVIVSLVFSILVFLGFENEIVLFAVLVSAALIYLSFILGAEIYMLHMKYTRKKKEANEENTK